jgi:predicted O-methyltransferase YrrM
MDCRELGEGLTMASKTAQPVLQDMQKTVSRIIFGLKMRLSFSVRLRGSRPREGSSSAAELLYLTQVTKRTGARLIGEIGFNAGFSSYTFLNAAPEVKVVSFDLNEHASVGAAKKVIDKKFPGRHTLICGDSRQTVPQFAAENPDVLFDLVFVDGGHEYDVAKADLMNMRRLSSGDTAVIMDDLVPWLFYGEGPAQVWHEAIRDGIVCQQELFQDGEPVESVNPPGIRAWALGRYLL